MKPALKAQTHVESCQETQSHALFELKNESVCLTIIIFRVYKIACPRRTETSCACVLPLKILEQPMKLTECFDFSFLRYFICLDIYYL